MNWTAPQVVLVKEQLVVRLITTFCHWLCVLMLERERELRC